MARAPNTGRRLRPPESIAGIGEDELAALTDLALRPRELGKADRMADRERRARLTVCSGAKESS